MTLLSRPYLFIPEHLESQHSLEDEPMDQHLPDQHPAHYSDQPHHDLKERRGKCIYIVPFGKTFLLLNMYYLKIRVNTPYILNIVVLLLVLQASGYHVNNHKDKQTIP